VTQVRFLVLCRTYNRVISNRHKPSFVHKQPKALGPDARKTRSKMTSKDRSLSVSITHSPAELPDEIIVRSSTNPVAGEGERIPVIPSKSPRKCSYALRKPKIGDLLTQPLLPISALQSPHSSNVDDRKKLRASVALTNFHSTLGDDHTVIGAFSVSQQGNKRKSMQPGDIDVRTII
jgi:hypothetical protein